MEQEAYQEVYISRNELNLEKEAHQEVYISKNELNLEKEAYQEVYISRNELNSEQEAYQEVYISGLAEKLLRRGVPREWLVYSQEAIISDGRA